VSKIEGVKCETCGKISFDYMKDKWIIIEGSFAQYGGRKKNGEAFCSVYLPSKTSGYHYCSWECLKNKKESYKCFI